MKFYYIILALALVACQKAQNTPVNSKEILAQQKVAATLWFQQSAEMEAVFLQAYNHGKLLLAAKLDTLDESAKYAVVLDLDETVLDNSPYEAWMIETNDTYSSSTWQEWTSKATARALPGALDFVTFALENNVEVFYISNRKVSELLPTIKNLKDLNFPNADSTHVLLRTESSDKTARRASVSEQAKIILFVGDNLTDYSQKYADRGADLGKELVHATKEDWLNNFIMLPNPTYGEWEKVVYGNDYSLPDSVKVRMRLESLKK